MGPPVGQITSVHTGQIMPAVSARPAGMERLFVGNVKSIVECMSSLVSAAQLASASVLTSGCNAGEISRFENRRVMIENASTGGFLNGVPYAAAISVGLLLAFKFSKPSAPPGPIKALASMYMNGGWLVASALSLWHLYG